MAPKPTSGTSGTTGKKSKVDPEYQRYLDMQRNMYTTPTPRVTPPSVQSTSRLTPGGPGMYQSTRYFSKPEVNRATSIKDAAAIAMRGPAESNSFSAYGRPGTPAPKKPPPKVPYTPHTNSFTGIPGLNNPKQNLTGVQPGTFRPGGVYEVGTPSSQIGQVSSAAATDPGSNLMDLLSQLLGNQQPSQAAVGPITMPELPRSDLSGLMAQFSPSINSAYDQLLNQLTGARSQQAKSFEDLIGRVTSSYAPARQDVQQGSSGQASAVQDLANRFGLGRTTTGEMGQRWAETGGRLENLASQNQAAQLGSLDTLRNARDSMYNTFQAAAQGGRAGSLADLASSIASGQSEADVARSNAQAQLAQGALSGQLNLAQLAQQTEGRDFDRRMKLADFATQLQNQQFNQQLAAQKAAAKNATASQLGLPQVSEEITTSNPGFMSQINALPDPQRQLAMELLYSNEFDPIKAAGQAYSQMRTNDLPQAVQQGNQTLGNVFKGMKFPGLSGIDVAGNATVDPTKDISTAPTASDEDLMTIIALLQQISPQMGGMNRRITSTTKSASQPSLDDILTYLSAE